MGESVKMHMLEVHVAPFARYWGFLYLVSEEGFEGVHNLFNNYHHAFYRVRSVAKRFELMNRMNETAHSSETQRILEQVQALRRLRPGGHMTKGKRLREAAANASLHMETEGELEQQECRGGEGELPASPAKRQRVGGAAEASAQ